MEDHRIFDLLSPEQRTTVEPLLPVALALPADAVHEPEIPVHVFLDEGYGFVAAGRQQVADLGAVGMPETLLDQAARALEVLRVAQTVWSSVQRKGRSEELVATIERGEALREDGLSACELALRYSAEGQRRLSGIRQGEGLADLTADLFALAQLYRDAAEPLAAIKVDAVANSEQLESTAKALQMGLSLEEAQKSLSSFKELRDRFFTLTLEPLAELRAFARHAFRKDKSNNRRLAFTSAYRRRRNRRVRQGAAVIAAENHE